MASRMVEIQKRAYIAQAMDAGRRAADALVNVSPAEQFAILATISAAVGCPQDSVYLTSSIGDCLEAASVLDGVLARHPDETWAWGVGSGCYARIQLLPMEDEHV